MTAREQPKNPLHGITLAMIVDELVGHYGWEQLARRLPLRCFANDPSVSSSLTFLRRTPWARAKVEEMYLELRREHGTAADGSAD